MFESLDSDQMDRSVQPVHITNEATGYHNILNSMMDHVWDGFYSGQLRQSRFPAQVEVDQDYTIQFSGTPPNEMRFRLNANKGGITVKIPYGKAMSIDVIKDGGVVAYTPWDEKLGRNAALTKLEGCGENRFVGLENFVEFYLTVGCEIKLRPKDTIMTAVRMDWSLEDFYGGGGVTRFADRVAAALGIHVSTIKVVAVYEGDRKSVV